MIALLDSGYYVANDYVDNINDFLVNYVSHIGAIDMKIFRILVNSNEMSTEELIEYINNNVLSYEDRILEVYELGNQIY